MANIKCPKCGGVCDYVNCHPDGIAYSNLACTVCDWFEPPTENREATDDELKNLPF